VVSDLCWLSLRPRSIYCRAAIGGVVVIRQGEGSVPIGNGGDLDVDGGVLCYRRRGSEEEEGWDDSQEGFHDDGLVD
jgi:hypothetical protein